MREKLRYFTDRAIVFGKSLWYGSAGEPVKYGSHDLRYLPGTRPPRMKYLETGDNTTKNELRQIDYFLKNVRQGDLVIDAGAHVGQYAVFLGSLVGPSGRVISFEPDHVARSMLGKNISLNGFEDRVTVESLALSDENGSQQFFSLGGNSMSSLARSGLGSAANSDDVEESLVSTMRLDDYLKSTNIGAPDFVKIDTEGAEISILAGGLETLRSARAIICELHPYVWSEFGTSFSDLIALVEKAGRTIEYIDPSVRIADGPVYGTVIIA